MNASHEIKKLVNKLSTDPTISSGQAKYEAIVKRKSYEHDCFLQCVLLRLETHRGGSTVQNVQTSADTNFTKMLSHVLE